MIIEKLEKNWMKIMVYMYAHATYLMLIIIYILNILKEMDILKIKVNAKIVIKMLDLIRKKDLFKDQIIIGSLKIK